ncbi:MAG: tRNA (adenosine(37)-N6)-threonylcarbamoyltransferase complex dimerization subunit type 1 TsaB [Rhodopirellula sp.]|nr:tRNA (adenosine(37)-N6)-threonylcarbamoyltransferase complex dimerization subunit type 1 TsaB [Rhodopirellula sp.]
MKILALETTERTASVAAIIDDNLLLEKALEPGRQSARCLAPAIKQLLADADWQSHEVELVAVAVGPGSFTGLRLGMATAKTFAYCTGARLLGVGTFETIAAAAPEFVSDLSLAVDAQRGQVVVAELHRGEDGWFVPSAPSKLLDADVWLTDLPPFMWVGGPALRRYSDRVPASVGMLPQTLWAPSAAQVGRVAYHDWGVGRRDDLWTLSPIYSRRSAAEEKLER